MNRKKNLILELLGLFLAILLTATVVAVLSRLPEHYRLSKRGIESQGIVVSKKSHNYIEIEYKVDDRTYETGGHAEDIGKIYDLVNLGEKVTIYFDPLNAETASLGNPARHLQSSLIETCVVSTFPILGFFIYLIKKKGNKNPN